MALSYELSRLLNIYRIYTAGSKVVPTLEEGRLPRIPRIYWKFNFFV